MCYLILERFKIIHSLALEFAKSRIMFVMEELPSFLKIV